MARATPAGTRHVLGYPITETIAIMWVMGVLVVFLMLAYAGRERWGDTSAWVCLAMAFVAVCVVERLGRLEVIVGESHVTIKPLGIFRQPKRIAVERIERLAIQRISWNYRLVVVLRDRRMIELGPFDPPFIGGLERIRRLCRDIEQRVRVQGGDDNANFFVDLTRPRNTPAEDGPKQS